MVIPLGDRSGSTSSVMVITGAIAGADYLRITVDWADWAGSRVNQ
jgi:hypothetical protein